MTLIKSTAAGIAIAALLGGAAMAGGDKAKTSAMGADTGRAADTASTSAKMNWTQAQKDKMAACKAMTPQAMAADAECARLKAAKDAHKAGHSGAATATPR